MRTRSETPNPFRYGKPVPPSHFIGRKEAFRKIRSRLSWGESTALVGEPHIGKTSMLHYISDKANLTIPMENRQVRLLFVYIDCHGLPISCSPEVFWQDALEELRKESISEEINSLINAIYNGEGIRKNLRLLFNELHISGFCLVLLIDEFDTLLYHPNLNNSEFLGSLRSFAVNMKSLALVTATRLSVAEMNNLGSQIIRSGSPFFNHLIEIRLQPLHINELNFMIDQALKSTGVNFPEKARDIVADWSGGYPFIAQMTCSVLFDVIIGAVDRKNENQVTAELTQMLSGHFSDLWNYYDDKTKSVLKFISGTHTGFDLKIGDFERELHNLISNGTIRPSIKKTEPFTWLGEHWRINSRLFSMWISSESLSQESHNHRNHRNTITTSSDFFDLRSLICRHFSTGELVLICDDLGIPPDDVVIGTLESSVANLIRYCERRELFEQLVKMLRRTRPSVNW